MKKRKLYKRLLILLVLIYAIFTLVNQQKVINQYTANSKELASKIDEQKTYNKELVAEKENVNSKELLYFKRAHFQRIFSFGFNS